MKINLLTKVGLRMVVLALVAAPLVLTGCKNDDDNSAQPQTIAGVVGADARFSILNAAVVRAGLASALSSGTLTVFAPTDAAFNAAGITQANIGTYDQPTLVSILQHHVLGVRVRATDIQTGTSNVPTLLNNQLVYVTKTSAGAVSVNGARVTAADIPASNGVIHVIDRVLIPPTVNARGGAGDLVTVVQADTSLSLLTLAAVRVGSAVLPALSAQTGSGLTLFAPTNSAFRAINLGTPALINAAPVELLTSVLTYHVVPGRIFSPTLTSGNQTVNTVLPNGTLTVNAGTNGAVTVLGRGNGTTAANVTMADIAATNGVIHKIDRVLLP